MRKTGARGLRSIMEGILLDTMFELPSLEGVEEVVISREVVEGTARPLYIYADRSDQARSRPRWILHMLKWVQIGLGSAPFAHCMRGTITRLNAA